jgi:hypothetical protein
VIFTAIHGLEQCGTVALEVRTNFERAEEFRACKTPMRRSITSGRISNVVTKEIVN